MLPNRPNISSVKKFSPENVKTKYYVRVRKKSKSWLLSLQLLKLLTNFHQILHIAATGRIRELTEARASVVRGSAAERSGLQHDVFMFARWRHSFAS